MDSGYTMNIDEILNTVSKDLLLLFTNHLTHIYNKSAKILYA